MTQAAFPQSWQVNPRLADWLRFDRDRTVTVFSGKVELGQGIGTALAQIAAEELEIGFERVRVVSGDTACTPNEWWTSASVSVEIGGAAVRAACAEARALFLQAAARALNVAADTLEVRDGVIASPSGGAKTSYWELALDIDLDRPISGAAAPRPPERHRVVGRSLPRLDLPQKLCGGGFIHDLELPGMLHGRVLRPPAYGARLVSADRRPVEAAHGVTHFVVDGSFVGVCAQREEQAVKALDVARRACSWRSDERLPAPGDLRGLLRGLPRTAPEVVSRKAGAGPRGSTKLDATYSKPYIAHASIGPSCALAAYEGDRLTVWSHTQGNFLLRAQLARALGMPESAVRVIHRDGAGCYGHNGADDVALDAALLARAARRPVRVLWGREDELAWSPYGPAMTIDLSANIDDAGRITHWRHELFSCTHLTRPGWSEGVGLLAAWHLEQPFPVPPAKSPPLGFGGGGERNAIPLYEFPSQEIVHHLVTAMPLRVSALRALGAYANVFAIECFLDELAAQAGVDPVALRLRHLADERAAAVIRAALRLAGPPPRAAGESACGRGLGFARYKNTGAYCAVVVDAEVDAALRVRRAVAAVDAGLVINPDGLKNQIEGGIVQAISWTLKEEVRWDRERVLARSWEDYPILGIAETPQIEVELLGPPGAPPLGVGECMTGPTAAAVGNALFAALGVRVRDLPLTPERIARCIEEKVD